MSGIYFSLGLIFGIIIFQLYTAFLKHKRKTNFQEGQPFFQLIEESKDVIYHFEVIPEMKFIYISPSLDKFIGKGTIHDSFENPQAPFNRIHPDDLDILNKKISGKLDYSKVIIQRWRDVEGNYRWFEEYTTPIIKKGQVVAIQGIMRNIDEKVRLQQDLEYRINHDALTELKNRMHFESIFTKYNEQVNSSIGIILCDLDELKYTNDHFGHKMGDNLIKEAAKLLNQFSSQFITVARIGGDEFVLVIEGITESELGQLVANIFKEIDEYNDRKNSVTKISMSIGFTFSHHSIGHMTELFSRADQNMYRNKVERKQLCSSAWHSNNSE